MGRHSGPTPRHGVGAAEKAGAVVLFGVCAATLALSAPAERAPVAVVASANVPAAPAFSEATAALLESQSPAVFLDGQPGVVPQPTDVVAAQESAPTTVPSVVKPQLPEPSQAQVSDPTSVAPRALPPVGAPDGTMLFPGETPPPPLTADPAEQQRWWANHLDLKMRWLQGN